MKRYLKAGMLLTMLGAVAASTKAADAPETVTFIIPPPPERVIKIEIGFEPGPPDEAPRQLPAPTMLKSSESMKPSMPAAVNPTPEIVPAVVPPAPVPALPPIATVSPAAQAAAPVSLAALQSMALGRPMPNIGVARGPNSVEPPTVDGVREAVATETTELPIDFVDQALMATMQPGKTQVPAPSSAAQARALANQYRLLNNVRLRYYHLLALQQLAAVREEMISLTRDAMTAIDNMNGTGQAGKAELLQARIEAREQVVAAENARAVYEIIWTRMAKSIGQPGLALAPVAGDLEKDCGVPEFEAAWTHVRVASPELIAVRGEIARRQTALRQHLSGDAPEMHNREKMSTQGPIAQALSRMGSSPAMRDPHVTQTAWTELTRCEADLQRAEQALKQRLTDAYARCNRARGVVDVYRASNLPEAKEAFELSVMSYRKGQASWPQVLMAQRNYFRMSIDYIEALAELRRAELAIFGLALDMQ